MRHIVVGTDFSAPAGRALARAARLARISRAVLEVMHVVPVEQSFRPARPAVDVGSAARPADQVARMQCAALRLGARFAIPVHVHLVHGKPHIELAARAAAVEADLLVVGASGERAIRGMLLGSTAQRVQRRLRTPLLIVRNGPLRSYSRVVVGIDFSAASGAAARAAARLFQQASLHYLHVCNVLFEGRLAMADLAQDSLVKYRNQVLFDATRELRRFLVDQGVQGHSSSAIVTQGYPPARIKEAAAELGASLIALGTKGKSRLESGLFGSVSEQFVDFTSHDVLLVKPEPSHSQRAAHHVERDLADRLLGLRGSLSSQLH